MPTVHIETEELLKAALQLPPIELEKFVTKLFVLKAKEHTPSLSQRESELLLQINQTLQPPQRKRLNLLIKKRQAHTITSAELQELKQMTHEIEKSDALRLKCLIELAALRNVPLDDLIKQLGLKPYSHD
ncbi:MAG: STAS/SEC14 domain-containing protein [Acidobacteria bacterium]|nr:STAS/SEC14 domain-containing protein [Acidobacteriota bacterium]